MYEFGRELKRGVLAFAKELVSEVVNLQDILRRMWIGKRGIA